MGVFPSWHRYPMLYNRGGDAFEKLIYTKPVRFTRGLLRVVGLFNKGSLQPDLAYLGVALAGSASRVKGVEIGR